MYLDYTIRRSSRRQKLTITVERDRSVVVHAPESTSDASIRQVVESRRHWISEKTRHKQKFSSPAHPPGKELVNGESVLYLGRQYQIELTQSDESEIRFEQRFLIPAAMTTKPDEVLRSWYIERAREKILSRVKEYSGILGAKYSNARIVDTRYRWGSCTVRNNVTFNWRLIKAPMYVIDYVIVHELTHILEANHTPRFWNIIRAQSPKMEKAKNWLLEHGQILEDKI